MWEDQNNAQTGQNKLHVYIKNCLLTKILMFFLLLGSQNITNIFSKFFARGSSSVIQ